MIYLDYKDKRPIYEQVLERFSNLIVKGVLAESEKMPSVRSLAMELSINPNTIQRAYQELERSGYIYSMSGKGSFVSPKSDYIASKQAEISDKLDSVIREALDVGISMEYIQNILSQYHEEVKHD